MSVSIYMQKTSSVKHSHKHNILIIIKMVFTYLFHSNRTFRDLKNNKIEVEVFGELRNVVLQENEEVKMTRESNYWRSFWTLWDKTLLISIPHKNPSSWCNLRIEDGSERSRKKKEKASTWFQKKRELKIEKAGRRNKSYLLKVQSI